MKRQQTQMPRRIQRADEALRYGYSIQGAGAEAEADEISAPGLVRTVLRVLAAVPLSIAMVMAYLAALVIERLSEPVPHKLRRSQRPEPSAALYLKRGRPHLSDDALAPTLSINTHIVARTPLFPRLGGSAQAPAERANVNDYGAFT